MMLTRFSYIAPDNLEEALDFLQENHYSTRILAGGTDLLVELYRGEQVENLLDIKKIPELQELVDEDDLFIGAAVPVNALLERESIHSRYPLLVQGAETLGSYPIRNRATVVGNICNASPAGDLIPPLLVLGTIVHCWSREGSREIPLQHFFQGPGRTVLQAGELVAGLKIKPPPSFSSSGYWKKSRIRGPDLAAVSLAYLVAPRQKIFDVALGAVAPTPLLFHLGEYLSGLQDDFDRTRGQIVEAVQEKIRPISDLRGRKEFRQRIVGAYLERALERVQGGEQL